MDNNDLVMEIDYPILATKGVALFPHNDISVEAGRVFSKKAIRKSNESFNNIIVVVPQKNPTNDTISLKELSSVGTIAKIKTTRNYENGIVKVSLNGISRCKINSLYMEDGLYLASVELLEDIDCDPETEAAYVRTTAKVLEDFVISTPNISKTVVERLSKGIAAAEFTDVISQSFVKDTNKQIALLNELHIDKRLELCIEYMTSQKHIDEIEHEISEKVRKKLDNNQREYILREKLRAIKEELGDVTPTDKDCDGLRKQVNDNPYPEYVKNKALSEIKRLEMMSSASAEYSMQKGYIDWLLNIPWYQKTEDTTDILKVEEILNEDHYGLEKIKERILEYLAVKTVTNSLKAPIICFSGPPGVGKTSLAKSIARALNKKFVKLALGGVKDESEIRGHRRTYIGALPGRILQSMTKAKTNNPVFLLDEIDKMSSDYKGDPTSAMLEVLDSEQNHYFSDHYLEEPYDLSNVFFIATANYLENIPAPLRDRLEIVEVSSYTEFEKFEIAKKHLIDKQLKLHGLSKDVFTITDQAVYAIIQNYTREAGVRELERLIGTIVRRAIKKILMENAKKIDVDAINLEEYLGKIKYIPTKGEEKDQVGVVTGLAYTAYGGDTLPIEVTYYKGSGKLSLTGKLGDVMKESAQAALSYVKANADKFNIDFEMFNTNDIHIHAPEGAIPKDGPSAGVTIATAIISALSNREVRHDIGMTGEITLRGSVLPIGGVREKSIAAHRVGLNKILIPKENLRDLDEVPESVKQNMEIIPIETIDDAVKYVLK